MKPRRQAALLSTAPVRPEVFMVLEHSLSIIFVSEGRWSVSVDSWPVPGTFGTQAEAWEAGVRTATAQSPRRLA